MKVERVICVTVFYTYMRVRELLHKKYIFALYLNMELRIANIYKVAVHIMCTIGQLKCFASL